ncbi:hypothetical protein IT413_05025 [Candidatus Peregrinibacteria bacterium]|nr:hypothetical protein [Candidatus Peregrinibacteria bacterium]
MSDHSHHEGSSFGKLLGKVRRTLVLTDEEIEKHKELSRQCRTILQRKIDQLTQQYGNIASLATELSLFQTKLILAKTDYLKTKEREETSDINEEIEAFQAYIEDLYQTSSLKKAIDEHDVKPRAKVLSIVKKIEEKVHRAS